MLSVTKFAIGAIIVGATCTAGVGSIFYFMEPKEQTIEQLIKSTGSKNKLLIAANVTQGAKAWNKYKEDKANNKENWKIIDWETENPKDTFPNSLIEVCAKRKQDKVKRVTDIPYINFINWCTVESA